MLTTSVRFSRILAMFSFCCCSLLTVDTERSTHYSLHAVTTNSTAVNEPTLTTSVSVEKFAAPDLDGKTILRV